MQISTIERVEMVTIVRPAELSGTATTGTPFLQFEVRNPDGTRWEVTCNGDTGAVVDLEREVSSAEPLFQRNVKINEADARKAAQGAQPGEIVGVAYELASDGTPLYAFDMRPPMGRAGMMVEVNAATGEVSKVLSRAYAPTSAS